MNIFLPCVNCLPHPPLILSVTVFSSWFLRQRPEPDRGRPVRPPPSPPDHEEDDDEGPHVAAELGGRAAAGARGRQGQHRVRRLRGRQPVLLARDWPELQAASQPTKMTFCFVYTQTKMPRDSYSWISSCLHWSVSIKCHMNTNILIEMYSTKYVRSCEHVPLDLLCFTPVYHITQDIWLLYLKCPYSEYLVPLYLPLCNNVQQFTHDIDFLFLHLPQQ